MQANRGGLPGPCVLESLMTDYAEFEMTKTKALVSEHAGSVSALPSAYHLEGSLTFLVPASSAVK